MSFPVLFCLLRTKTAEMYVRLLTVVKGVGEALGLNIFDRPVRMICDFDVVFVTTVRRLFPSVKIKCCLFHFVKNIRNRTTKILTQIKHEKGKKSDEFVKAQQTKRRLMMIPFLPVELLCENVLKAIDNDWNRHGGRMETCLFLLLSTSEGRTLDE